MLDALEADRSRLTEIEAQILDLERSLSALRSEQALVQERLGSYKYPVLTLPNEIVSEVFVHFLPVYPLCPPLTGTLSPTFLTHICRKWREVALGTPALWRAISVDEYIPFERQSQISDIWIRRSGSCPLSIYIDSFRSRPLSEMLPAVFAHRVRWEHLKLYIHLFPLSTIDGPMPLLRSLDLTILDTSDNVLAFHQVPLLRTVVLNYHASSNVTLPWVQLTSLTLIDVEPNQYVPILQQTANLVYCHLSLFIQDHVVGQDITLPCLESFVLSSINPGGETEIEFLDSFIVPALRRLELHAGLLGSNPIDSLSRLISKSGCKLETVRVTVFGTEPDHPFREAFPSIPNFSFIGLYLEETTDDEDSEDESNSDSSDAESGSGSE